MSDTVNTIREFEKAWEEVRACAGLIKSGRARIVKVTREDGSVYHYTKEKKGAGA